MQQHQLIKIPLWVCWYYLRRAMNAPQNRKDIGLQDGELTNTLYQSRRSNFRYIYLRTTGTRVLDKLIAYYLSFKTGIDFTGGINDRCAPINFYSRGQSIKVHRDRNMITGAPIDYIATIVLQQPKSGGHFYYNDGPQQVSADGKKVEYNIFFNNFFNLKQGEVIILRNDNSVHGVSQITEGTRVSLTFRSRAPKYRSRLLDWLRARAIAPRKENFYLLTSRLVEDALAAEDFGALDLVKQEFYHSFKNYTTHEDFGDAQRTVRQAINDRTEELHNVNFS